MKPVYIKNRIIPFGRFHAITLFPFVFYKGEISNRTRRHEEIHFHQQIEMLVIPFYLLYVILWIFYGYYNNPLEREAYSNDYDLWYLKERKAYKWIKYF